MPKPDYAEVRGEIFDAMAKSRDRLKEATGSEAIPDLVFEAMSGSVMDVVSRVIEEAYEAGRTDLAQHLLRVADGIRGETGP